MRMITCSTRLYEPENEKLLKIKEETGTCISSLIREAVCNYLETKEETESIELDPAIIAKRQDDWLFGEYEDPKTTEAN